MDQDYILIDGIRVHQPDEMNPQWETTFTEDTDRTRSGHFYGDSLFTVESYSLSFSELTPAEASTILQHIIPRPGKLTYTLKFFSWYHGGWRTEEFYTGKGSLQIKTLKRGIEKLSSISFNAVKVDKVEMDKWLQ